MLVVGCVSLGCRWPLPLVLLPAGSVVLLVRLVGCLLYILVVCFAVCRAVCVAVVADTVVAVGWSVAAVVVCVGIFPVHTR